nr:MAG TPA: hypothetical protein [Bacteriophage sp.]
MRPYYYVHNQSSNITIPTDPVTGNGTPSDTNPSGYAGTDIPIGGYKVTGDGMKADGTKDEAVKVADAENAGSNF